MADLKIWENPSLLSKERLRSELERFNIKIPASYTTKNQLVTLYETSLSHLKDNPAELQRLIKKAAPAAAASSPSNATAGSTPSRPSAKRSALNKDVVPAFIKNLSDAELHAGLTKLGETVGPISAVTRAVYEKKYARLLEARDDLPTVAGATSSASRAGKKPSSNGSAKKTASKTIVVASEGEDEDDESESEDEEIVLKPAKAPSSASRIKQAQELPTTIANVKDTAAFKLFAAADAAAAAAASASSSVSSHVTEPQKRSRTARPVDNAALFSGGESDNERASVSSSKIKTESVSAWQTESTRTSSHRSTHAAEAASSSPSSGRILCYILLLIIAGVAVYVASLSPERRTEFLENVHARVQERIAHLQSLPERVRAYVSLLKGKDVPNPTGSTTNNNDGHQIGGQ
eukprot:m.55646 g.55646  ORF g.55646 m.55646 type:complete len:406 (-) comp13330_c0_seq1:237-1454(-)